MAVPRCAGFGCPGLGAGAIWLEGKDKLQMRGYVGVSVIGRTAEWKRVK